MFGFLADYLASSFVIDVMQCMVGARCTHSLFKYRSFENGPKYSYTSDSNSGIQLYCRTFDQTIELRSESTELLDIEFLDRVHGHLT